MNISLTTEAIADLRQLQSDLDKQVVIELGREDVDKDEVQRLTSQLTVLNVQLQQDSVAGTPATADATPITQEAPMADLNTESLGLAEDTPVEAVAAGELSVGDLGLSVNGKDKIYNNLTPADINDLVVDVDGNKNTYAGLVGPNSITDKAHMIEVNVRGDLKKAARGLALYVSGALQEDGSVIGTKGDVYTQKNGNCTLNTVAMLHTLDGDIPSDRTRPCPGIPRYRGNGKTAVATKKEDDRCLHMWAWEFRLQYFVIFKTTNPDGSNNQAVNSVKVAMAETAGDADARKVAAVQVAEWRANTTERKAIRGHVAAVHNHARNIGVIGEDEDLPPVPEVADFIVEDAKMPVKDIVNKLGGRWFYVDFVMPMKDGDFEGRARARNLNNLAQVLSGRINAVRQNGQDGAELRIAAITGL